MRLSRCLLPRSVGFAEFVHVYQNLDEFSDGYAAPLGKTAAVGLDAFDCVKGFGREIGRPAVRATHNGDVLDNQQAGALTVTAGQMSDMGSATTAVLTTDRRVAPATPHRQSEYTAC